MDAAQGKATPRPPRRWLTWLSVIAVVVSAITLASLTVPRPSAHADSPPRGQGERDHRILSEVTPVASRAYAIARFNGDSPVGFSPCRTWPVVVNTTGAPAGAYEAVTQAVAEVSAASGLALIVETTTDEAPSEDRSAYQPQRYGDRWAPILVAWTTGGAEQGFAGHGGPVDVTLPNGTSHYVSGQVTLDAQGQFNQRAEVLHAILLHELGHVVGLSHSPSQTEIMAAANDGQTTLGSGDLAGLATVGAAECTDAV